MEIKMSPAKAIAHELTSHRPHLFRSVLMAEDDAENRSNGEVFRCSDEVEAASPMKNPEQRAYFIENGTKLGLNPEKSTTFDWLEADDRASFKAEAS